MIAEGIPCEFREEAMILMRILSPVCEDERWVDFRLQLLKTPLHFAPVIRQETILKLLEHNLGFTIFREQVSRNAGFLGTRAYSAKDNPVDLELPDPLLELEQC